MRTFRIMVLAITAMMLAACTSTLPSVTSTNAEAEIRQLLNRWERAFREKNVDAVMALYAPGAELVAYDIVPPLQTLSAESYRRNYEQFFAMYDGPLEVELRDLRIVAGTDTAFLHCLDRMSGTLKGGQRSDLWLRVTSGLRKIDGAWLIVHDHVSVPVNLESGTAALDLRP